MLSRKRRNVENEVTRPMMLRMLGGTRPRVTSRATQIVRISRLQFLTILVSSSIAVAVQALGQTIVHLTKSGRFRQAADREKEIAQIYLKEANDVAKACESFERAGEWYAQEDAQA